MIYGLWLRLRHLAYNKGWKKSFKADVPTVCVGNITTGGTGKTPHVEMLLHYLRVSDKWGYRPVAVLSRGYKRKSRGFQIVKPDSSASFCGDEPLQIARKFHGVTVAVDKDRVEGCRKLDADIIILDDAFQYRRLIPSLSIVLVDYGRPVWEDKLHAMAEGEGSVEAFLSGSSFSHASATSLRSPFSLKPMPAIHTQTRPSLFPE